jgi:hypothetical protein
LVLEPGQQIAMTYDDDVIGCLREAPAESQARAND